MTLKPTQPASRFIQIYQAGFVILVLLMLLFIMFMSIRGKEMGTFEETLLGKNVLIQYFNRLRMKLGDHVFNNALIGKDGWMEFTGDNNLDDYQNALNFTENGLAHVAATIKECHEYAKGNNMTFLIVVAPNKASIYPDKLPEQIQPLSDISRIDQLNSYLRSHNIPEVLDLRPALRGAREQRDVFYRMGTHWTEYGAYVAYKTIINHLSKSYPELEPYSAKFLHFDKSDTISTGDRDIATLLQANHLALEPTLFATRNLNEVYLEADFPIPAAIPSYHKVSWIPDSELPSLLLYHDSFGNVGLNRFLALNFRKVYYIHRNSASVFLNWPTIEQFAPDIVMYEIVERNLIWIQNEIAGCRRR